MQATVPPPSVPLSFLVAAGIGLAGFGLSTWLAADVLVAAPTASGAVSAVHMGVLAFLSTAVLGAMHQFVPVVGHRLLRSVAVARVTLVLFVVGAWMLPGGFAHGPDWLVPAGGTLVVTAVLLAVWNLSRALASPEGGIPIVGLRLSAIYLVTTVSFGIVYAFSREEGWFALLPHRTLAHGHLGLLGWLGLTYLAVAERLWPMFLLSHRPSERAGAVGIGLVASGVFVLVPGLLFAERSVAVLGGAMVIGGLAAHLVSLASIVRHRRRSFELLHAFLATSTVFLVVAVGLGVAAGLADVSIVWRSRLASAEVAALIGWLSLAVIGHTYKVVPFISYTALRSRGIRRNRDGGPLLFADLFDRRAGIVDAVLAPAAFACVVAGLLASSQQVVAVGGAGILAAGVLTTANLGFGSWRMRSMAPSTPATPVTVHRRSDAPV